MHAEVAEGVQSVSEGAVLAEGSSEQWEGQPKTLRSHDGYSSSSWTREAMATHSAVPHQTEGAALKLVRQTAVQACLASPHTLLCPAICAGERRRACASVG